MQFIGVLRCAVMSKPKGRAGAKRAAVRTTISPSRERVQAVTLKLPIAYLHILGTEADRLRLKRGAFLTLLLQRKRGEVRLERAKDATGYDFTDRELTTFKLWIWYMTPETRRALDADRIQMGLNTIGNWVTQALNRWIDRIDGLRCES
jgi:hypothetical protein